MGKDILTFRDIEMEKINFNSIRFLFFGGDVDIKKEYDIYLR